MKPRVHYALLEDMQKYIPNFNPSYYESVGDKTDLPVIEFLRNHYNTHLPVDVTAWIRVNEPDENLIYKDGLGKQLCFVRDTLCQIFFPDYKERDKNLPMVISTHRSKSVLLPVYQIKLKKYGIEIILRYNFYDWKVSIASKTPIECDFMGLFDEGQKIPSIYCEGFPENKVYGSYSENKSRFTVEIRNDYKLYTFMFLLKKYLETALQKTIPETIYGLPIVPYYGKNKVHFDEFEGIIIAQDPFGGHRIEIIKMIHRNNTYTVDCAKSICIDELIEHETSGRSKAEFLVSKAKEFGNGTEKIAICENLVFELQMLDETWERFQKLKNQKE